MRILSRTLAGLAVLLLASCSSKVTFAEAPDSEFKAGQVWKYKARVSEPDSTLTVCKVETAGRLGTIIHVSINGVKIKSAENRLVTGLSLLPFSESAIKQSITQLLQERAALPDHAQIYQAWRKRVEKGNKEVFTVTVAEAIAAFDTGPKE